jgi:hypothetical protein
MMCRYTDRPTAASRLVSHCALEGRRELDGWTVEVRLLSPKRVLDQRSLRLLEELSFVPFTRCTLVTCSRVSDASQPSLTMETGPFAASRPLFPCSSMISPCPGREEGRRLGCGIRVSGSGGDVGVVEMMRR